MIFLNKHKYKFILAALIAALFVSAFFLQNGTDKTEDSDTPILSAAEKQSESVKSETPSENSKTDASDTDAADDPSRKDSSASSAETAKSAENQSEVKPNHQTGKSAEIADAPHTEEAQNSDENGKEVLTCTLSISCGTILGNMNRLKPEKVSLVPKDGIILAESTVTFNDGESVFNLLLRETKKNKIHMEFHKTPVYNSAYIEGINNLYEFDCGELSGWMYRVNGEFPNYGCSRYKLKPGDKVEWLYTCDLGADIGSRYMAGEQNDE